MGEILLGAFVLICVIFILRAFVVANPSTLVKVLRYVGAGLLGAGAVFLFLTERPAAAAFVASAAWGLVTGGHVWPGGWPPYGRWGRSRPAPGQSSTVRTSWLEMALDHDTGEMNGTVLQGPYAGHTLRDLDKEALMALYAAAQSDPETIRLLEAWLDRSHGDWRTPPPGSEPPPERSTTGMSRAEALKVLGLQDGCTEADIRAAHRRLMLQNHPDRGGSDYLASKINEAKDVLLGD